MDFKTFFILTARTDIAQNEHSNKSKVIYTSTKKIARQNKHRTKYF